MCWDSTYDADRAAGLFKMAFKDPSEICFGAMTGQIQSYGKIGMTNAGSVGQIRVNCDLSRVFDTGWKSKIPNGWREYSISSQII